MTTNPEMYALRHVACGHVISVATNTDLLERVRSAALLPAEWFITPQPTDDDLAALLRGQRCPQCSRGASR